jgi:hypothetical protein
MTTPDSMPSGGAPIAGLIGLGVAVLVVGLLVRRRTRRGSEIQPEEG